MSLSSSKAKPKDYGSLDGLLERWDGVSKVARSGITCAIGLFILFLPLLNLSILDTPEQAFASVLGGKVVPYVLIALGLNVVIGQAGLLDLGYVGFFAVGAYTVGVLTAKHASWPWFIAIIFAVVITMAFGVLLGAPTLRLRGDYLAIVTLGFGEIIRTLAKNLSWLGAAEGISPGAKKQAYPPSIKLPFGHDNYLLRFGVAHLNSFWYLGVALIALTAFLLSRLENSRVGRAWDAIREDEDAAELMGVPTFVFKLWAFAIGAAIGGLAGGFYYGNLNAISPDQFEIQKSIMFLAAVVLGGIGNRYGVILGAFLVAYLPDRFRFLTDKRFFVFGIVLMLMMLFRPEGLLPRRLPKRVRLLAREHERKRLAALAESAAK